MGRSLNTLISDPGFTGAYWGVPLAAYVNPKYVGPAGQSDAVGALGFPIIDCASIIIAVDSLTTPTYTATIEQTMDPTGVTGWFSVYGKWADSSNNANSQNINQRSVGYVVPRLGVRMRIRVTALTVADLRMRIMKSSETPDFLGNILTIGSAPNGLGVFGMTTEDSVMGAANAVPIGAQARDTQKTQMSADGDMVHAWFTRNGRQVMVPWSPAGLSWAYAAAAGGIVSSIADVVLKAAAGAGIRNVIESLDIDHDLLSAVTEFVVKDGAAVIYRGKLQTPAVQNGGTIVFPRPLRGTANTALNFALLSSVTGGVYVNAAGHTQND